MSTLRMNLSEIRIDGGTQSRVEINLDTVAEYAEAIEAGGEFPPIELMFDGVAYWLVDGFHRYHAFAKAKVTAVTAEVIKGTQRDAWLRSLGVNARHGLRRSNADKRKAVAAALADPELSKWSSREIAQQCAVSARFVDALRHELSAHGAQIDPVRTVRRGDQVYAQDTSNIGASAHGAQIHDGGIPQGTLSAHGAQIEQDSAREERAEPVQRTADKGGAAPPATPNLPQAAEAATPGTGTDPAVTAGGDSDPFDGADPAEVMASMDAQIRELQAEVEALSKGDHAAELREKVRLIAVLERRLGDQMRQNTIDRAELDKYGKWYADLRKVTGVDSRPAILGWARARLAELQAAKAA